MSGIQIWGLRTLISLLFYDLPKKLDKAGPGESSVPEQEPRVLNWDLVGPESFYQSFEMVEHLVFTDCHGGEENTPFVCHRHLSSEYK